VGIGDIDYAILSTLAGWRTPVLDAVALGVSGAGYYGIVWMVLAVLSALSLRTAAARMAIIRVVFSVLIANTVVNYVVKPIVGRDRPFVAHVGSTVVGHQPSGPSFPSGHATVAAAGATAMTLLWPGAALAWWLLAAVTIVARVYMGVHYPTDVLGGTLLGIACAWLATGGARCYTARPVTPGVPR